MKKAEILIVEDDLLTATVIQKYLTNNGYDVTAIAANATDAFKEIDKLKPDLILMDIFLRNSIDGIEIARVIREKFDIPVIYLTADSSEDTIARAKITEPFEKNSIYRLFILLRIPAKTLLPGRKSLNPSVILSSRSIVKS